MTKRTFDSEILTEGYKSYHKALFAVMEFRRQATDAIWQSLETHMENLADAIVINQDLFRTGIAYAAPDKISQSYDGTSAQVGFRMPRDWKQPWQMYFFVWVDDKDCQFCAQVDFKSGLPIEKLRVAAAELGAEARGFDAEAKAAWISEAIPVEGPHELSSIADSVLDRWIKLWKRVGGLPPLLPRTD